jgi:small subunit ribosomal protein S5
MEENKNLAPAAAGDKAPVKGHSRPSPKGGQRKFAPKREEQEYEEKIVKITRVSKTVKGGKRIRFTALVVIGDGKGKFGYGLGKAMEVPEAIKKALASARRNVFHIEIAKNESITHQVYGKFGATQVFLKPAPEGTGLVAGGAVRAILELAGIKNVYSKIYGSRTKNNVVKATVDGLRSLKSYGEVNRVRYNKDAAKAA